MTEGRPPLLPPETSSVVQHEGRDLLDELSSLSDSDIRDASVHQLDQIRTYLNNDLFAFAWVVLGYDRLYPPFHRPICDLIARWGKGPGQFQRIMVQCPRGSFKSTLCTISNALWQVVNEPNAPVVIFNEKEKRASNWVRTIRTVCETSHLFRALYADLLPPGIANGGNAPRKWAWNDQELLFNRDLISPESSITAHGLTAASAGSHWRKVIKDDLISEEARDSEKVMQSTKDWDDGCRDLEDPARDGQDFYVCTPWSYNDVYKHVLERHGNEYVFYRRQALVMDEETGEEISAIPFNASTKKLKKEREKDSFTFNCMMQCTPASGREQSFDYAWVRNANIIPDRDGNDCFRIAPEHFNPNIIHQDLIELMDAPPPQLVPLHWMTKALILDPAPSEESQKAREGRLSNNAIIAAGQDPWGRKYLLETWARRVDPLDVIRQLFSMMERWKIYRFACEEVVFSKLYKHFFEYVRQHERPDIYTQYIGLSPGRTDKDTRILGLIPEFKMGLWYFNTVGNDMAVRELIEYPNSGTKDTLDGLSYATYKETADRVLPRPESPEERSYATHLRDRQQAGTTRDPVTGY